MSTLIELQKVAYLKCIEDLADLSLEMAEIKVQYSNNDFMNALLIFQSALMNRVFDLCKREDMEEQTILDMADKCGNELSNFIKIYTDIDTKDLIK